MRGLAGETLRHSHMFRLLDDEVRCWLVHHPAFACCWKYLLPFFSCKELHTGCGGVKARGLECCLPPLARNTGRRMLLPPSASNTGCWTLLPPLASQSKNGCWTQWISSTSGPT